MLFVSFCPGNEIKIVNFSIKIFVSDEKVIEKYKIFYF
jgi:hypothetical protein